MQRIESLDGYRGVAVLGVSLSHTPLVQGFPLFNTLFFLIKKSGIGHIAVEMFFVLSGYLITSILLEKIKQGTPFLTQFYIKRLLRLAPVSLLAIAVCAILFPSHNYFYNLFFTSNYYFAFNTDPHPLRHFWSLAVEEQFYFIWPFLLISLIAFPKRLAYTVFGLMVLSLIITLYRDLVINTTTAHDLIYRGLESRAIALLGGCAIALYGTPRLLKTHLWSVLVGSFLVSSIFIVWGKGNPDVPTYSIKAICFFLIAMSSFLLTLQDGIIQRVLSSPFLRYVGMVSYGLYVYHLPVFYTFGISHMQIEHPAPLQEIVSAWIVTIGVTLASWYWMEKPIMSMKKKAPVALTTP